MLKFQPFSATLPSYEPSNYPKYDIRKEDDLLVLDIATAGFSKDELEVKIENRVLCISGKKKNKKDHSTFLRKNISEKDITLNLNMPNYVVVNSVSYVDGILSIVLEEKLPEAMKPRVFEIN